MATGWSRCAWQTGWSAGPTAGRDRLAVAVPCGTAGELHGCCMDVATSQNVQMYCMCVACMLPFVLRHLLHGVAKCPRLCFASAAAMASCVWTSVGIHAWRRLCTDLVSRPAPPRPAMPCPCHAMSSHAVPCHAMPRHAMPCHTTCTCARVCSARWRHRMRPASRNWDGAAHPPAHGTDLERRGDYAARGGVSVSKKNCRLYSSAKRERRHYRY